jgi:hypothetical protein
MFVEDNPLVTEIPARAKLTKTHKTQISFSYILQKGLHPPKQILNYSSKLRSHITMKKFG